MNKEKTFKIEKGILKCYLGVEKVVAIPEGVTEIDSGAFKDSILANVISPIDGSSHLDSLMVCTFIEELILPSTLTKWNPLVVSTCFKLKKITVNENNNFFSSINGHLYSKDKTIFYWCPQKFEGNFIIPEGVEEIGPNAFAQCTKITNITMPKSLKIINNEAFNNCTSLQNISIPYGVTKIPEFCFTQCENLQNIEIPDTVYKICRYAFNDCSKLETINFSENVICLGDSIFSGCFNLKNININEKNLVFCFEDGVLYDKEKTCLIYISSFHGDKFYMPESVSKITKDFFTTCNNLKYIRFSQNINKLPDLFSLGSDLEYIDVSDNNPYFTSVNGLFYNKSKTILYKVPSGITGDLVLPDSTVQIFNEAFCCCRKLKSITIPPSVTKIWNDAFSLCNLEAKVEDAPDLSWLFGPGNSSFIKNKGTDFYVKPGSYGEKYAIKNDINYKTY